MFNVITPYLRTHLNPYPEVNIAREIASSRTQNKHKKDKETFDKQHRTPHFEVNDLVLVKNYRHPDTGIKLVKLETFDGVCRGRVELINGYLSYERKNTFRVAEWTRHLPETVVVVSCPRSRSDRSMHPDHNSGQLRCLVRMDVLFWIDVCHIEGCKCIDTIAVINNQLQSAIAGKEKIFSLFRKHEELEKYLDPEFLYQQVPDNVKMELVLAREDSLRHLVDQLQQMEELKPYLDSEHIKEILSFHHISERASDPTSELGEWLIDSAATSHFCKEKDWFVNYQDIPPMDALIGDVDCKSTILERTSTYSPEQNGIAERFNRTAIEGVRAMLLDSGLQPRFWAEALNTFVYTKNRCEHALTKGVSIYLLTPVKCTSLASLQNRDKLLTLKEISGRVPVAKYIRDPIIS
ncbi:DCTN3 [Cordylochernes scorpioides]|uniref:DCTN3 n=1 Tax=Cordylochernes scorpioides TaxID=51811 RepID=A0ABY6L4W3_9ARAC|nr:DCTN3 [Cordylochernes scorpioides]